MKLYGISNCDTVKKARAWLEAHGISYEFHDWKKNGVDPALLARWMDAVGWEQVVNRNGITWRKLPEAEKAKVRDKDSALAFLQEKPSAIRRPAFEYDGKLVLGFDPDTYAQVFGK
ncbi:ArsC family reductase [Thiobacter aerophilum]|uniref:ArsC family reductase n=1 Tax=Thiobacter aerophilum TaxID=3121275 RepID=A0ABV0EAQ8_9BURK